MYKNNEIMMPSFSSKQKEKMVHFSTKKLNVPSSLKRIGFVSFFFIII